MFWHTQGSGKSYSMAFFAEKVRRVVPGNFTFLLMTDRDDLDDQIYAHLRRLRDCGRQDTAGRLRQGAEGVAEARTTATFSA